MRPASAAAEHCFTISVNVLSSSSLDVVDKCFFNFGFFAGGGTATPSSRPAFDAAVGEAASLLAAVRGTRMVLANFKLNFMR